MASQVNPIVSGNITEDPRFNQRFGLSMDMSFPALIPSQGGPPSNTVGQNGDFAFRDDGTTAGHTIIYHKESGSWVATGA
jgi:hypothetical protein